MNAVPAAVDASAAQMLECAHCALPIGRLGQRREVGGEARWFCCYGCCLAYQVHHGERDEPQAAAALIRLGVGAFLTMNIMAFSLLLYSGAFDGDEAWLRQPVHWLLALLATPLVALLGAPFFAGAAQALAQGRLTTDVLVGIGVLAAYGYSLIELLRGSDRVYFDTAAMVLVLFTLGRYLEAQARVRAARSLAPLLAAERAEARVLLRDANGAQREVIMRVRDIAPGVCVRVLPGERVAVDGVVVDGASECNEEAVTGQPQFIAKSAGMPVHAGSINGSGPLEIRAAVAGAHSRWQQVARMVREALARKSMIGVTVDRIVAVFIPGVLLLALATAGYWNERAGIEAALMTGLAVLVVACPCSLGLAAPLANALAIAAAASRGIVVRGGGVLEKLARLDAIAFDKTGTVTDGELRPHSIRVDGASTEEVMHYARALACASDHPVARAIAQIAADRAGTRARRVEVRAGAGMRGDVDGTRCALGTAAWMAAQGWTMPRALAGHTEDGGTRAFVGWDGCVRGCVLFADTTRADAPHAIRALQRRGLHTLLASGDAAPAVARLAAALGVERWHAELMPEDKVRVLREAIRSHGAVAMVGDGINDGPVLAAATVGIAVGGASDLAKESADVILPRGANGMLALPWLLELAANARHSLQMNLVWAFGYNAIALALAAAGLLQPVLAAALMAASSVIVVLRSWRAGAAADRSV